MTVYDSKKVERVWRGLTLTGAADSTYSVGQTSDSFKTPNGVQGEGLNVIDHERQWKISMSFLVNSKSLPILIQDNDNHVEDTLIIRDPNIGKTDTFTEAVIINISEEKDAEQRTVTWNAKKKNGK